VPDGRARHMSHLPRRASDGACCCTGAAWCIPRCGTTKGQVAHSTSQNCAIMEQGASKGGLCLVRRQALKARQLDAAITY